MAQLNRSLCMSHLNTSLSLCCSKTQQDNSIHICLWHNSIDLCLCHTSIHLCLRPTSIHLCRYLTAAAAVRLNRSLSIKYIYVYVPTQQIYAGTSLLHCAARLAAAWRRCALRAACATMLTSSSALATLPAQV